ncbi:MAG TPA: hypothetical protein VGL70_01565 [Candidatus Binatia bacterium]|jgi:hypothetical protein
MKNVKLFLSVLLLIGAVGVSGAAFGADGILFKEELWPGSNYCHMKFPAIRPSTLGTDHPVLQNPGTGDMIDFYGPCDENPLGQDQVQSQILDYEDTTW